jgi:hypothetical protein
MWLGERTACSGRKDFYLSHAAKGTEQCDALIVVLSRFGVQIHPIYQFAKIFVGELFQAIPAVTNCRYKSQHKWRALAA